MEHIRELEAEIDQLQSQLEAETEKLKGEGDTQGKVMHV
jgi:frataxin-like iron-binding protein CyaY